ncbi:helix-turn-helix transcriptional regulator [Amycolatopsis pittospori]|uniref:helix-turn-helix transcriptional regulator n=1 Tax=Amycolatopsis pittospori TaxID=2749434 RepID=UPI0015F01745|nr:LuxR family transcriptional regulator [Amycolatopsis pittospori]
MELAERGRELEALDELFSAALRGSGQIALITGGVASGKTQLLNTFANHAAKRDALVLTATGSRAELGLRLGVVEQLFGQLTLPPENARRVLPLLEEQRSSDSRDEAGPAAARILHELSSALLAVTRQQPLLLGVDDVQFVDAWSLETLLYLQRRMRSARLFVVLNEWQQPHPRQLPFHTEVARLPYFNRLRLAPLSRTGVAEVLSRHLDTPAVRQLAPACHDASGGNPLLVHALLEDLLAAGRAAPAGVQAEPVVGDAFEHAVLSCLHRWEPRLLRVAQGLAVLGSGTPPHLLGRLLDMTAEAAAQVLQVLSTAGLLHDGGFRHLAIRRVVLSSLSTDEFAGLHRKAAELRHEEGESATTVAQHLIAANSARERWAVEELRKATAEALAVDRTELAVSCLELAHRECGDERQRASLTAQLAQVEWRFRPATANLRIARLQAAARDGYLDDRDALVLIKYLIWHGRAKEAADTLGLLFGRPGSPDDCGKTQLRMTYSLLSYSHPTAFPKASAVLPVADEEPVTGEPWMRAASALTTVLNRGPVKSAVDAAEHVLQTCALADATLDTLLCALQALMYADCPDKAAPLCDLLLEEASRRGAVVWQSQLSTVRAELALRQGDPLLAAELARSALRQPTPASGDDWIGGPVSVLLQSAAASGDFAADATLFKRSMPESMFKTWLGPQYLFARGQFFLATGRIDVALNDFHQCGALMRHWEIDHPALAPWRTGLAKALLLQNRPGKAAQLLTDQLALPGAGSRTRGTSLRFLAVAGGEDQRLPRLRESVELLRASGDRLELAAALAELGAAHRTRSEFSQAHEFSTQAIELARACQADILHQQLLASRNATAVGEKPVLGPDELSSLSKAEWRVASLAALGNSNRAISRRLGITISTVEQHLTKVYRKLRVNSRADLPAGLPLQRRSGHTATVTSLCRAEVAS